MADRQTIPVTIQGREYRVRSGRDPQAVREAAALLDETMERLHNRTGSLDTVEIALLAALNIADSLVGGRGRSALDARCEKLALAIEAALEAAPGQS